VSRAKADILPKMLKMAPKHRRKQPAQVFAQLFKHQVDEQLLRELPTLPKDSSPDEIKAHKTLKLRTRNKITYQLWKEADEETRNVVFTHKAQLDHEAGFISDDDESREDLEETDTAGQISRAEMQK
jgi:DNA-binding transcriptional regulator WhiA